MNYNRHLFSTAKIAICETLRNEYEIEFYRSPLLNGAGTPLLGMENVLLKDTVIMNVFEFDNFLNYVPLDQ